MFAPRCETFELRFLVRLALTMNFRLRILQIVCKRRDCSWQTSDLRFKDLCMKCHRHRVFIIVF